MASLGYTKATPLKVRCLTYTSGVHLREAEVVREQLKEIGLDMSLERMEIAPKEERARRGDFDIIHQSTGVEFDDPDSYHGTLWLPDAGRNYTRWKSDEWVKLYQQQRVEGDRAKRAVILRQMAKIWFDDMAFISTLRPILNYGWWGFVRGFELPVFHQTHWRFDHVWLAPH